MLTVMTATSHPAPADSTRARILEATVAAIERGGVDSVRVLEIAAAADVTTGAIYHHFTNRRTLVVAAQVERFTAAVPADVGAIASLLERATSAADIHNGLMAVAQVAFHDDRAQNRRRRAEVVAAAGVDAALAEAISAQQHSFIATLQAAVESTQHRQLFRADLDAHAIALLMMVLPFGFRLADVDDQHPIDVAKWCDVVSGVVRSLLDDPRR